MGDGFWGRVAGRVRPSGALKTIENPRVVVRALTITALIAAINTAGAAAYWLAFEEPAAAAVALGISASFVVSWAWFATTGSVLGAGIIAVSLGSIGNVIIHVLLGGYANSGGILLFGVAYVVSVALLLGKTATIVVTAGYTVAGVVLGVLDPALRAGREAPAIGASTIFFVMVLVSSNIIVGALLVYFTGRLAHERRRSEALLLNVLPAPVAAELKATGATTAQTFEAASVLFADIVGFTAMSATMDADEMVTLLGAVFSRFDALADEHGVEKIRTIGDNYMAAAGVPVPVADHADRVCAMAIDMIAYSRNSPFSFRIGINSGPIVGGVIGVKKFQYDIWGDTVNIASRMESQGEPGRIQVTEATHRLVEHRFPMLLRGSVAVRGAGAVSTWWLGEEPVGA